MGTVIEFPAARRLGSTVKFAPLETGATVLILPVIRIERQTGATNRNSGPQEGNRARPSAP